MKGIRIAVDGYSSTGKSTMARQLAAALNFRYIDTGAMYRAVTYWALEQGYFQEGELMEAALIESLARLNLDFQFSESEGKPVIHVNGRTVEREIRGAEVASKVSIVAQISEVRRFLVKQQQAIAEAGSVVMDGRDIASVVMPDAELKIFMTADPKVRAQRRFAELQSKGMEMTLEEVAKNLEERDYLDTHREDSPLIQTKDALVLDNTDLGMEEQLNLALSWAKERQA